MNRGAWRCAGRGSAHARYLCGPSRLGSCPVFRDLLQLHIQTKLSQATTHLLTEDHLSACSVLTSLTVVGSRPGRQPANKQQHPFILSGAAELFQAS
ncbi:unnamed protein product [Pleuronectes platessa]|uniref:Uncharacterized protein n=1 Tax=Pleuronectes platessa TaxID=8262 RepID=A0A9N7TS86_PLEPL|nr:unnamed protein product [Pleuronectes platessa]